MKKNRERYPALIIGSGIAGLSAALELAERGVESLVVTKAADPGFTNTSRAQGGIIWRGKRDSPASLTRDMLAAGGEICNVEAVRFLAKHGPRLVSRILIDDLEVPFDREDDGALDLTREAAHSLPRIVHAADATGRAIQTSMLERVRRHPKIKLVTNACAIDLLTTHHHSSNYQAKYDLADHCYGAYILDVASRDVYTVFADYTVLASGGLGQLYLHTTNTRDSIGDGVVMAERAGAALLNVEYVQFHPTTLFHPLANRFLISEALRGEGARLRNQRGEYFMKRYSPKLRDLAPRDVVTRAIVEEMIAGKEEFVYLDLAGHYRGSEPIPERFPTIANECKKYGIDITREPIPVVPAAHYFCGGILVSQSGESTLPRLYAIGETSCTGVHGANRLASTSLLEGLTWGHFAARAIAKKLSAGKTLDRRILGTIPDWQPRGSDDNEDPALIQQDWSTIRNTLWNYAGIIRTTERLERAVTDLRELEHRLERFYHRTRTSKEVIELFHGTRAARLLTQAALKNPVSRGCHYRRD